MNTVKHEEGAGRRLGLGARLGWLMALALLALPVLAAADKTEKQLAKLEKKVAAKEASIATKQAKVIELQALLDEQENAYLAAQLALEEAELLPQDTPEEIKAAQKAIHAATKAMHRASKRMDKFAARIAKLQEKIAKQQLQLDALAALIDALTPGGLPTPGDVNVDGLELPEQMSLVQAIEEEDNDALDTESGHHPSSAFGHGLPGDSPYFTDESHTWVYDPSMKALGTVNEILCMLRQSAYDQMVNRGPYTAQVDPALCDVGGDQDGQDGQVEEVELWTVNSVRSDDDTAHVVGVWVPQVEGNGPGGDDSPASTINARMEIIEEPSAENPFGVFAMDFEAIPVDDPDAVPLFWGTLETQDAVAGTMGFSFFEVGAVPEAQFEEQRAVHVQLDAQGNGLAHVSEFQQGPFGPGGSIQVSDEQYLLAFDGFHLLRTSDGVQETCLSRTEFETTAWRYNLYYASGELAGQRVERNGGFGIATEDGHYGWVGYHGLWLPPEAQIESGDVVLKNTWDVGDSPEAFTVLQAPGKLYRNTRKTLELSEVDGMTFEWWDFGQGGQQGQPSQYLVTYQHGTGEFLAIAQKQGESFVDLPQPVVLDTAAIGWLSMWSASLGGNVVYVHGESGVTYFQEEIVTGNDALFGGGATVDLYGWVDVLAPNLSGSEAQAGQVFLPVSQDVRQPYVMVFDHDDLGLYLDDGQELEPVGLADGESYQGGPFHWGMRSGPMVTDPGAVSDVFQVWDQEVFYVWETGPNPWNHLTTLIDEVGDYVEFDPPLQFSYVHAAENDIDGSSEQAGKTFMLEFNGPGELQGIPHEGVDLDDDGQPDRWYPLFGLADGTKVGPTGTEYVVRAMEKEQRLAVDAQGCQGLDLSGAEDLTLPDGSTFELPNLGAQPVVDGPPAVIAGVVQTTDG